MELSSAGDLTEYASRQNSDDQEPPKFSIYHLTFISHFVLAIQAFDRELINIKMTNGK